MTEKGQSVLGAMEKRKKTDLRLPIAVTTRMKELADAMGIPANAVYAAAAAQYVIAMSHLRGGTSRLRMIDEMEKLFQSIVRESRKLV